MASLKPMTVYGAAGAGRAAGTTHFTVLLAAYLSDVRHRGTTVLEWNDSGDFAKIYAVHADTHGRKPPPERFHLLSAEYVPAADRRALLDCRERGRDAVVIDFGVYREGIEEEFLRCDRRFIIGGTGDWQVGDLASFAAVRRKVRAEYLAAFGGETQRRLVERILGIRVHRIPWSPETGRITGELLRFFGFLVPQA